MADKKPVVAKKGLAGYMIDFTPVKDMTLGQMFGTKPVPVTQLMKKLWEIIKSKDLKAK